jgi:hypothetical protein
MDLVVVLGKSRKNVLTYILLPPDCKMAIQLLLDTRPMVNVPSTNKYVFARLNAETPISGTTDIRDVVNACPLLEFPERISSTTLRKYIATVSQVINYFYYDF